MGPLETLIVLKQCDLAMEQVNHHIREWNEVLFLSRRKRSFEEWLDFHLKGI